MNSVKLEGKVRVLCGQDLRHNLCSQPYGSKIASFSEFVRFEVFTAVTMKNAVFLDVTPCGSCKNQRFSGTWRLLHQGDKNR
jgi:hypothetical protein